MAKIRLRNFVRFLFLVGTIAAAGSSAKEPHVLHVGFQDTQPKYILENGAFSGVCPEIYSVLESRLKGKIRIAFPDEYTPRRRILHYLERGTLDLDCGAGFNQRRAARFTFSSVPLYEVSHRLVIREGFINPPESFAELAARQTSIGVLPGTAVTRHLQNQIGGGEGLVPVQSPEEGLRLVALGRLEGFYYHSLGLNYYLVTDQSNEELVTADHRFHVYEHWMMYSPHLTPEIIAMIDEALLAMKSDGTIAGILSAHAR